MAKLAAMWSRSDVALVVVAGVLGIAAAMLITWIILPILWALC